MGTTFRTGYRSTCRPVHPHARGDDVSSRRLGVIRYGSPPRAWGRRNPSLSGFVERRFTPTRVGTTQGVLECVGSPPRAWGRPVDCVRLIHSAVHPHARGDDETPSGGIGESAVHPHARGDDIGTEARRISSRGSPPRAWGRLPVGSAKRPVRAVHPHARGDDTKIPLDFPRRQPTTAPRSI